MPYNNTPIAPAATAQGTANLPLARVKKIIGTDEDVLSCSNNAAFVITVAAEMFIQYLSEQTHIVLKTERKQRRTVQYRDVANAVSRIDNLEFLSDVVPKTTTIRKVKEAKKAAVKASASLPNGQSTLDGSRPPANGVEEEGEQEDEPENSEDELMEPSSDEEDGEEQEVEEERQEDEMDVDHEEEPKEVEVPQLEPKRSGRSRRSGH